eukprot:NODE_3333_length_680_cov_174.709984_g2368_i0.p1 GENE.NODE_3333_length_680_cov_174.709984_g2368_i0~~NODE_3333_length_680_cov_174.709984_g2368_i0.p1  ORF type:complete len:92 (+),score=44.55 NODE_3333_length_680_cov_174.709984_g2368_i0:30-278(+)
MGDKHLSRPDAVVIFANVQDGEDVGGDGELSFREFNEALVAIGLYRTPSPLIPPAVRLDIFINRQLFPQIRLKLPKLKLPDK